MQHRPFLLARRAAASAALAVLAACGGGGGDTPSGAGSGGGGNAPPPTAGFVAPPPVAFPVSAGDLVWDEFRQLLYLSLASNNGPNGNVIAALDPRTNRIVRSQFAGSEPRALALSDDGQYLYVALQGSNSVQRFRLPELTPDLKIPLDLNDFSGPQHAVDIQVLPGRPRSVVVAQGYFSPVETTTRTVVFDDDVARPLSLPVIECRCGSLQVTDGGSRLLAADNQSTGFGFFDISIQADGLRLTRSVSNAFSTFGNRIQYSASSRLLYGSDGTVFDPTAGRSVGQVNARGPMVADIARQRLFFATAVGTPALTAFDSTTLQSVGEARPLPRTNGLATRLVRWGTEGLALAVAGGELQIMGGAGTGSFDTAVPEGRVQRTLLRGSFNRLAWDAVGGKLYATVSQGSQATPSSLLVIDPATASVVNTLTLNSNPNALAVSDDGQFLYVAIDGTGTVQRRRLPGLELEATLALGSHPTFGTYEAGHLQARPGAPRTVAVSRVSPGVVPAEQGGILVFDDTVPRPEVPRPLLHLYSTLAWNNAGTQIYATSFYGELYVLDVDAGGVRAIRTQNAIFGAAGRLHIDRTDGLLYHDTGRLVDPATGRPLGTFVTGLGAHYTASDAASNRMFTLTNSTPGFVRIDHFDRSRYTRQRSYTVPYEMGLPSALTRVGPQHLAFLTAEGLHLVRLDPP